MEPATWASNEHLDPTHLNTRIRDAATALSHPPYAILANAPTFEAAISGSSVEMRFNDLWSNKMTPLTSGAIKRGAKVTEAGLYDIDLNITAEVDGGSPESHLIAFIYVNTTLAGRGIFTARHNWMQSAYVKRMRHLAVGDEITARVFADTGRTIQFVGNVGTVEGCRLSIRRIGASPAYRWP